MGPDERPASACAAEFIGTFYLVLTVALMVLQRSPMAPLAAGMMLASMIFAAAPSSGGHFNPAVTFGVWLSGRRQIGLKTALFYVVAQTLGAMLAGAIAGHILGATVSLGPGAGYSHTDAALVETTFSSALVFVVLNTATLAKAFQPAHSADFAGLAIGFTVLAGAFAAGPVSGSVVNPAAAVGLALPHAVRSRAAAAKVLHELPLYIFGPLLGAALAAAAFRFLVRPMEFARTVLKVEQQRLRAETERISGPERGAARSFRETARSFSGYGSSELPTGRV